MNTHSLSRTWRRVQSSRVSFLGRFLDKEGPFAPSKRGSMFSALNVSAHRAARRVLQFRKALDLQMPPLEPCRPTLQQEQNLLQVAYHRFALRAWLLPLNVSRPLQERSHNFLTNGASVVSTIARILFRRRVPLHKDKLLANVIIQARQEVVVSRIDNVHGSRLSFAPLRPGALRHLRPPTSRSALSGRVLRPASGLPGHYGAMRPNSQNAAWVIGQWLAKIASSCSAALAISHKGLLGRLASGRLVRSSKKAIMLRGLAVQ